MTLQTSGAISLANIQTEFGGSNPISMSEYYAGGSYVPSGTSGTNGAVPTSGGISMSKFYGTADYLQQFSATFASGDSSQYYGDFIQDYDYFYIHAIQSTVSTPIFTNATWATIEWDYSYGVFSNQPGTVYLLARRPIADGAFTNTGWTTVTITSPVAGVTSFNRTALTFGTNNDGTYYYGSWSTSSSTNTPDPFLDGTFGAASQTCTLKFT
jgi:hypothetical protein